jgi:predicted transglutaminase-like cysteine proteinase
MADRLDWEEWGKVITDSIRDARKAFIWTPDMKKHGMTEHWGIPEIDDDGRIRDDCDGFALYCYTVIDEQVDLKGIAKPMICVTETGGWHMVLAISTNRGTMCADNRQDGVTMMGELKRQGYGKFYKPVGKLNGVWELISE